MPDWVKEVRTAIASLNLEPAREALVVEEFSQHLRDRYEELLTGGMEADQAYQVLLQELNDSKLLTGLKSTVDSAHYRCLLAKTIERSFLASSGMTCATERVCC